MLIGGYKDRAQNWHWYDGSTWDFENWEDGQPRTDDPFPISTDLNIGSWYQNNKWGENGGQYSYICQSSSGN